MSKMLSNLHAQWRADQDPTDAEDPVEFVGWLYEEGHATFATEEDLRVVLRFLGKDSDEAVRQARELGYLDDGRTLDDEL